MYYKFEEFDNLGSELIIIKSHVIEYILYYLKLYKRIMHIFFILTGSNFSFYCYNFYIVFS